MLPKMLPASQNATVGKCNGVILYTMRDQRLVKGYLVEHTNPCWKDSKVPLSSAIVLAVVLNERFDFF